MKACGEGAAQLHAFLTNALKVRLQGADILKKIPLAYTANRNDSSSQYSSHYTDRANPATKISGSLFFFCGLLCDATVLWLHSAER
jgi:hypothetical protein